MPGDGSHIRTVLMQTLGCSKNTVDSEHVLSALLSSGRWKSVESGKADLCLVNTCSFIADAKEQSVNLILEDCALKAEGIYGSVVVFGCLGERYSSEMPSLIPEVDAWFGARDFGPLLEYLGGMPLEQSSRVLSTPAHYAYLKISEGCDRRCSYCAIPFIRGAHHSVPMEALLDEARCLAGKGVRELIVIAQDSTWYGLDLYGRRMLAPLLEQLAAIEGIEWIRIHYSYPASFPEDVLDVMASNPKICKYMDIPLQHASSSMLASMHRGIDEDGTRALVSRFREKVPGLVLRTTMIVGYPGETEEDFSCLLRFVEQMRFERLGAFTYSEEEGTWAAENLKDDVPEEVKRERYDRLMSLQERISMEYNRSLLGTVRRVVADSFEDGVLVCRSESESPDVDGEILVGHFPEGFKPEDMVGRFFDVRISGADSYDLSAEILE